MKIIITFFMCFYLTNALAHCPFKLSEENACFLLDQNIIYIYDTKFEHNGPYKNLNHYHLVSASAGGKKIAFLNSSRGIIKLDATAPIKSVELQLESGTKKMKIIVKSE